MDAYMAITGRRTELIRECGCPATIVVGGHLSLEWPAQPPSLPVPAPLQHLRRALHVLITQEWAAGFYYCGTLGIYWHAMPLRIGLEWRRPTLEFSGGAQTAWLSTQSPSSLNPAWQRPAQ